MLKVTMALVVVLVSPTLLLAAPCPDADDDGWADCSVPGCDVGGLICGDCDDAEPGVNPGEAETCNHRDDDCDGPVDEGFAAAVSREFHEDRYPTVSDRLGFSVTGVGDVDGDGVPDIAVGAPLDDLNGWDAGVITLYSGADRRVLWRTTSTSSFLYLGNSIEPIGDVDGDGVADLLNGSPIANAIVVLSGADGREIVRCVEPAGGGVGELHGVAALDDLTGDGVPEIAAGATTNNQRQHHQGKGTVFTYDRTARTCTILLELWDPEGAIYDNLGYSVAGIGDVTGDGIGDIAVGEPGDDPLDDQNGAVLVFSGADGALVRRLTDPAAGWRDNLGVDVHGIEDIDGDGVADIVASTERRSSWEGEVLIFSGASGAVLRRLTDASTTLAERLGGAIDVVGDVDGDGLDDIVAGGRYAAVGGVTGAGRALVLATGTGAILGVLTNAVDVTSAYFGYDVAGVGDLTGDGVPEFVVGAPYQQTSVGAEAGTFSILALESVCDADGVSPFEGDCDDTDASVWGRTSEARDVTMGPAKSAIDWSPPLDPGTSATITYDTLRSSTPHGFDVDSCLETGESDTSTSDPEAPTAGGGFYYLVRGVNACGGGALGAWGGEPWPREVAPCP